LVRRSISCDPLLDIRLRHLVLLQAEGDVLLHAHMREQRIGLEHHVGWPPEGRDAGKVLTVQEDLAFRRRLETSEHAHQGGLAAAGSAQKRKEFALVDLQTQIVDRGKVTEPLGDIPRIR
jgi:hypothetical protein